MNLSRDRVRSSLWLIVGIVALGLQTMIVYAVQLAETNAYAGFLPIEISASYVLTVLPSILLVVLLMPAVPRKPSDFFRAVYGLFVPIPYALFHPVVQVPDALMYVSCFTLMMLPMIFLALVGSVSLKVRPLPLMTKRGAAMTLLAICTVAAIAAIVNAPSSASLSLANAYERRYEARTIFVGGSLLSYLAAMSVNGFVPSIAFIAGAMRRRWMLLASIVFALVFFYVSGTKAQFGYVFLAYMIGIALRRGANRTFYRMILLSFFGLFALFVVERLVLEHSFTAEFGFRRIFPIPSHVINSYYRLMFEDGYLQWSPLFGVTNAPDGVTFLVGEIYFGSDRFNVNTNAFIYGLAAGGIPEYLAALVLVCGVLGLLDSVYRATGNVLLPYLGFAFSILLVEQAATTVLVSSGLGVLLLLALTSSRNRREVSETLKEPRIADDS